MTISLMLEFQGKDIQQTIDFGELQQTFFDHISRQHQESQQTIGESQQTIIDSTSGESEQTIGESQETILDSTSWESQQTIGES